MPDAVAISLLEGLLNRALRLDREAAEELRALTGKTVRVELEDVGLRFTLRIEDTELRLFPPVREEEADLSMRFAAGALAAWLAAGAGGTVPGMQLRGSVELAGQLQGLCRRYEPDLEEPLSGLVGDWAAYRAVRAGKGTLRGARELLSRLSYSMREYLVHERGVLLDPGNAERFVRDTDRLRDAVEGLASRLDRLEAAAAERREAGRREAGRPKRPPSRPASGKRRRQ